MKQKLTLWNYFTIIVTARTPYRDDAPRELSALCAHQLAYVANHRNRATLLAMSRFGPPTACAAATAWRNKNERVGKALILLLGANIAPSSQSAARTVRSSPQCLPHRTHIWSGQHCVTIPLRRSCPAGGVAAICCGGSVRRRAFAAPAHLPVQHDSCEQGDQIVDEWRHIPNDHREHQEQDRAGDHEPSDPLRKRTPQERNAKNGQTCRCQ